MLFYNSFLFVDPTLWLLGFCRNFNFDVLNGNLSRLNFKMDEVEQWKAKLLDGFQLGKSKLQEVLIQSEQKIKDIPAAQKQTVTIVLAIILSIAMIIDLVSKIARIVKRKKANTVILAGLNGSGKSVLFYQNEKVKPVHLVDFPGHLRLRPKLDEYLPKAAGLVFVVDALEFLPNCCSAAEYLYDILTKASVVKRKIPVLIICNKSEKVTAHSKDFIRKQLEKEIDKLRASRTGMSDADITSECTLGLPGKPFAFSQCQNKVTLAEASGLTGEITEVEDFMREHVGR